jgi:hypothetical protein
MDSGSRVNHSLALMHQAAAGDTTALRQVMVRVMAAKPQKLATTIQVRVTEETAQRLDDLVARIDQQTDLDVTRSDLLRAALDALAQP